MLAHRRFALADATIELRASDAEHLAPLAPSYAASPAGDGEADAVIEIEAMPGFHVGRRRAPNHPAFETSLEGKLLRLERSDAAGVIDLAAEPLTGRFRIEPRRHSLEAAVRIGASIALPRRGALIVHASCVADRRGAHLFAGVSGAGKSTIAALLGQACGAQVELVSEELVVLAPSSAGWRAHVAPFLAKVELPHGMSRPLASLNFLEQAPDHERIAVSSGQALREMLRHVLVYARDPATADLVLSAAADLVAKLPTFRLRFAKNPDVAEVLGIT